MTAERRLVAILAADVVGYSRLTGVDEEGTLARLRSLRYELINPAITNNRGRVVKTMGDGILIEFVSVVDAVRCANDVQRGMPSRNANLAQEKRIEFRVGINAGDVVVEGTDLLGDAVNIAARLEGIAPTGGICLSEDAYRQVRGKVEAEFVDLGEQVLKNIAQPVRVYRIELGNMGTTAVQPSVERPALALPDKPSIAVLPFTNMSGDPEQDYFVDGTVEDIITGLSQIKWMFVIARNSSFVYKGKSHDIRQVGRELGVRYVLEGSMRKAGNRVRITAQLIDSTSGSHLWADRFDGALENIFELQDEITAGVVGAIEPAMRTAEIRRAEAKPTSLLEAYDCHLRAVAAMTNWTHASAEEALALCRRAFTLDPRYAAAYGQAAHISLVLLSQGWLGPEFRPEALGLARRAVELGADDPNALWEAGLTLALVGAQHQEGLHAIDRSLAMNPNSAQAWMASGGVRRYLPGEQDRAIADFQRALRLSPFDPVGFEFKAGIAWAQFIAGRYEEAVDWADKALGEQAKFMPALRVKLISCGLLNRLDQAEATKHLLLTLDPDATVGKLLTITPLSRLGLADALAAYTEGLRKVGFPE